MNHPTPLQTRRTRKEAYIHVRNALHALWGAKWRFNAVLFTSDDVRPNECVAYFLHSSRRLAFRATLLTVEDMWNDTMMRRATAAVDLTHPLSEINVQLDHKVLTTPYGNAQRVSMSAEAQAKFKARDEAIEAKLAELKSKPRRMMPSMLIARSKTFAADFVVAVDAEQIGAKQVDEFIQRYRMLGEPLNYGAIYVEEDTEESAGDAGTAAP